MSVEPEESNEVIDSGPAPQLPRRQLIFDSLQQIASSSDGKSTTSGGTYVYTWGAGYNGQLGRKLTRGQKKYSSKPKFVNVGKPLRQVKCGGLHSAVIAEDGEVLTWGDDRNSQLGNSNDGFVSRPTPRVVDVLCGHVVRQVACGLGHTVALTNSGQLYSWGWSKFGQTGLNTTKNKVDSPTLIEVEQGLTFNQVACGDRHTVAATKNGAVYSWGCGDHGQLGLGKLEGETIKAVSAPQLIETMAGHHIEFIDCGAIFTVMLTDVGEVFVTGFGEYLYGNDTQNFFYLPKRIACPAMAQVACGQGHIVALTPRGDVYCWGAGTRGQLGHGVKHNAPVPRPVLEGKNIVQVAAGRYHSLALTQYGALFSWGNNDNGQCGHEGREVISIPTVVEHMIGTVVGQICCGEHHTIALTSVRWNKAAGDVNAWLAGERYEQQLKEKLTAKSTTGLGRKELTRVRDEMAEWHMAENKSRKQSQQDEEAEIVRDAQKVEHPEMMKKQVEKRVKEQLNSPRGAPSVASTDLLGSTIAAKASKRARPDSRDAVVDRRRHAKEAVSSLDEKQRRAAAYARSQFLKESNALVQKMTCEFGAKNKASADAANYAEGQIRSLFQHLCLLKKDHDYWKHISEQKAAEHSTLKDEVTYLKRSSDELSRDKQRVEERLSELQMQLNTVEINIQETEENRKNYELSIGHLKEEELERFFYMEGLRKQTAETANMFRKMDGLRKEAERNMQDSQQALANFRGEISEFTKFAYRRLEDFSQILTVQRGVAKKNRKQNTDSRLQKQLKRKARERVAALEGKADRRDKNADTLEEQLDQLQEQLSYYQERFQRIAQVTGLDNTDAMINKFFLKEEIKADLDTDIQAKKKMLQEAEERAAKAENALNERRTSHISSRWKDIDLVQEKLAKSSAAAEKAKSEYESTARKLALLREGLTNIYHNTQSIVAEVQPVELKSGSWGGDELKKRLVGLSGMLEKVEAVVKERDEKGVRHPSLSLPIGSRRASGKDGSSRPSARSVKRSARGRRKAA